MLRDYFKGRVNENNVFLAVANMNLFNVSQMVAVEAIRLDNLIARGEPVLADAE